MGDSTQPDPPLDRIDELALAHLDGRLDDPGFAELEGILDASAEARTRYAELARLDAGLRDEGSEKSASVPPDQEALSTAPFRRTPTLSRHHLGLAAILTLLLALPVLVLRPWQDTPSRSAENTPVSPATRGVAVLAAEAGASWKPSSTNAAPRAGSPLAPGVLTLQKGLAQIDFYGGASVTLQGPAEFELIDGDKAILHRGRIRADVPPAARGFEILTDSMHLEDLGTSFGLSADESGKAELFVFDGEVRATGSDGNPLLVHGGNGAILDDDSAVPGELTLGETDFPGIDDVFAGAGDRDLDRYAAWREASLDLRADPRLIAYYDFENLTPVSRRLLNRAITGAGSELDGGIVGARVAEGRWEGKTALDFRREGDRVRFAIPGTFDAVTLMAWVRIDALDRGLNSLFLTDHYGPGEFHWQLSRRGALHFSSSPKGADDLDRHNRRFFSEPFWTPAESGRWFFLATTARSGETGGVTHYIDGDPVAIVDGLNRGKPLVPFRIGEADISNWTDPIWPDAAIRTLNGRVDEFAIFRDVLTPAEIQNLYESGKP